MTAMETRLNPDKSGCQGAFQAHAYGEQEAKDDKDHETYKAGWEKKKNKKLSALSMVRARLKCIPSDLCLSLDLVK